MVSKMYYFPSHHYRNHYKTVAGLTCQTRDWLLKLCYLLCRSKQMSITSNWLWLLKSSSLVDYIAGRQT